MVKHTETVRRQIPANCSSVFDHFVGLALKRLIIITVDYVCLDGNLLRSHYLVRAQDFPENYISYSLISTGVRSM